VKIQSPRFHKKQRPSYYSIESSQSLKARKFSLSGNSNGACEENDVSNS
jgi:hypothetical protein